MVSCLLCLALLAITVELFLYIALCCCCRAVLTVWPLLPCCVTKCMSCCITQPEMSDKFGCLVAALSMGLCVSMIALLRLPSLKVSCLLLSGLLIYDVFWVFFSSYLFNTNVMLQVATAQADNPVSFILTRLCWDS